MLTPDDIERMCQEAIANGADPDRLAAARDAAMREQGGTMASLAYNMSVHTRLERFERTLGIGSRDQELDDLRAVVAKYPDEVEKMLAALQKIREERGEG